MPVATASGSVSDTVAVEARANRERVDRAAAEQRIRAVQEHVARQVERGLRTRAAAPVPWLRVVSVTVMLPPGAPFAGTVSAETVRSGATSSLTIVTVAIDGDPTM